MSKDRNNKLSLCKKAVIICASLAVVSACVVGINYKKAKTDINDIQIIDEGTSNPFFFNKMVKTYNNLEKATKIAGFDFKVPDIAVNGFQTDCGIDVIEIDEKEKYIKLRFINTDELSHYKEYCIETFKENPKDKYSKIYNKEQDSKVDIKSSNKEIGNIKGENITITETNNDKRIENIFVYEDDGLYYAISYSVKLKRESGVHESTKVSEEDILKIINSMKKPEDINNIKYFNNNRCGEVSAYIYDSDDLNRESEKIGFKLNFIKDINDEVRADYAEIFNLYEDKKEFEVGYISKDNYRFRLCETNDDEEYNLIKDEKLMLGKCGNSDINSKYEKLSFNNKDVYKVKYTPSNNGEDSIDAADRYIYIWEDNNVYYKVDTIAQGQDGSFEERLDIYVSDILEKF